MPRIPKRIYTDYEKKLIENILLTSKRIQRLYNNAIVEVSLIAATLNTSGTFTLDLYPTIRLEIDRILFEVRRIFSMSFFS